MRHLLRIRKLITWRRLLVIAIVWVLYVILFGIRVDIISPEEFPKQLKMTAYDAATQAKHSRMISENDPLYERLRTFLAEERRDWISSIHPPLDDGPYVFDSEKIRIFCYDHFVAFRYSDPERYYFVEKKIPNLFKRLGLPEIPSKEQGEQLDEPILNKSEVR